MRIVHIFPFTLDIFNFKEEDWPYVDDALNYSLSRLNNEDGYHAEIHVLSRRLRQSVSNNHVEYFFHKVSASWVTYYSAYLMQWSAPFLRCIKKRPPDLVHIHASAGLSTIKICKKCLTLDIPYVIHYHGGPIVPRDEKDRSERSFIFGKAMAICAGIEKHRHEISSEYHISPDKIFLVPFGADTKKFTPAEFEDKKRYPRLLFVGRINRDKNALAIIRCLSHLSSQFPDIKLDIIGPIEDYQYIDEIKGYSTDKRLDQYWKVHGFVPKADLSAFYQRSHLFVFPSTSEAFGRVIIEAFASGLPVVALKDSGGPDELIEHEKDGLLIRIEDLCDALEFILQDKNELERMGLHVREKATLYYSYEKTYEALKALYSSMSFKNARHGKAGTTC